MEQKVANALKYLVLELAAQHLNFVLNFAHHVTVTQRLHRLVVRNLPLQQPKLLARAQVVMLLLKEVNFFVVARDFLEDLQALRDVAIVLRTRLIGEKRY